MRVLFAFFYWKYLFIYIIVGSLFLISWNSALELMKYKEFWYITITDIEQETFADNEQVAYYAAYTLHRESGSEIKTGSLSIWNPDKMENTDITLAKYQVWERVNVAYNRENPSSIYTDYSLWGIWKGPIITFIILCVVSLFWYGEHKFFSAIIGFIRERYRHLTWQPLRNHTVNICLIPGQPTYDMCRQLNKLDTWKYNRNSRPYIPHITLGMKTLNGEQIESLIQDFKKLTIHKISSKILEYYYKEVSPWSTWSGIYIQKTSELGSVQKKLLEFTRKYTEQTRNRESYAIDDFFEENEISFFSEDEYIARDEFHITLWTQDMKNNPDRLVGEDIVFDRLVIWKIWNYGSLREILYSKKLI